MAGQVEHTFDEYTFGVLRVDNIPICSYCGAMCYFKTCWGCFRDECDPDIHAACCTEHDITSCYIR